MAMRSSFARPTAGAPSITRAETGASAASATSLTEAGDSVSAASAGVDFVRGAGCFFFVAKGNLVGKGGTPHGVEAH